MKMGKNLCSGKVNVWMLIKFNFLTLDIQCQSEIGPLLLYWVCYWNNTIDMLDKIIIVVSFVTWYPKKRKKEPLWLLLMTSRTVDTGK